jgi:predicted RecA/RadA family phage recombinase
LVPRTLARDWKEWKRVYWKPRYRKDHGTGGGEIINI